MDSSKTIIVDVDGVIAKTNNGDYATAEPLKHGIEQINKLYHAGYHIILFTARYGDREAGCIQRQYNRGYEELKNWLWSYGVQFHELWLGKPAGILYIDDKGARVSGDDEDGWQHVWDSLEIAKKKDKYGVDKS